MTSTKPQTPAKDAKPAKAKAPAIDYSKLVASDVELPKGTRGSALDGTPFVEWMTDSRERKVAKSLTIPEAALTQTVYLIRAAAGRKSCGVRIVTTEPKDGNVTVTFQAKDKRKNKKDAAPVETPVETPAADAPAA